MVQKLNYKDLGFTVRIRHAGIFDMDGLLFKMRDWLEHNAYEVAEFSLKTKVPSPAGQETEIIWSAGKKVNEFFRFEMEIFIKIYDMKDVEVIKDGQKKTLTQASLLFEIGGILVQDWSNRFEGNKFLAWLYGFYTEFIIREDILTKWADELYYRVHKFARVIKEHLDFETKTNAYEDVW